MTDFSGAAVEGDWECKVLEREADEDLEHEVDEDVTSCSLEGVLESMNLEHCSLPSSETKSACVFHHPKENIPPKILTPHSLKRFKITSSKSSPQNVSNSRPPSVFP